MSRIHEALKKAEQERALSQPAGAVDSSAVVLDPQVDAETVMANASVRAGAAPALTQENAFARIRQTHWHPDPKTMLFFNNEEHASGMEEFRTLRSRLYQMRDKQPLSKLLITSPLPKEGKSFTTANLAQVLVRQQGRRALMIDADLRNPQMHELLGAEPGPGLAEYLGGERDEFSIIQRGSMENLFLIPAGRHTGNPAELVSNGRMRFLLNRLDPLFDWIIIDSPPAALVSDAVLLANYCDGVILVVRSNNTPVDAARRARKEFADHNVVGVVLNGISPELSPYAQYYYSAYAGGGEGTAKN
ncbi:MAG TPA: CpsD/CapB family tyrosine-protein kinase [Terriglobales bacterium]